MPHQGKSCVLLLQRRQPEVVNPKDSNVPMYWVRPARTLSASAGNCTVSSLDLTYPLSESSPTTIRFPPRSTTTLLSIPWERPFSPANTKSCSPSTARAIRQTARTKDGPACQDPRRRSAPSIRPRPQDRRSSAQRLRTLKQVRSLRAQIRWLLRDSSIQPAWQQHRAPMRPAKIAAELDAKAALIEGEEGAEQPPEHSRRPRLSRLKWRLNALLSALDKPPTPRPQPAVLDLRGTGETLEGAAIAVEQLNSKEVPALKTTN